MKHIALAFSGGGFRAAAFSMGTLSYLNEIKIEGVSLLQNVKFIGSSSGGTITNILYSSGICANRSFIEIYQKLLQSLEGESLIKRVFEILNTHTIWKDRPDKSRNLINAFSIAYDEMLYGGDCFGIYKTIDSKHLEEVCINSTEFTNGLSFRFQSQHPNKTFPSGLVGNYYIHFNGNSIHVTDKIKLADILACSSCFSGGFEPFIFPDDFTHENLSISELSQAITFKTNPFTPPGDKHDELHDKAFDSIKNRFGLMDGGIADNQAIESVLYSNKRRKDNGLLEFDLIMVTDVASYFMDGYTLPLEKKGRWTNFSIQQVINVIKITGFIFPILIVISIFYCWHNWMYLLLIPTFAAFVIYIFGMVRLNAASHDAQKDRSTWSIMLFKYVSYFLKLRFSVTEQMIKARLKSVLLLANDVYMKQIRRLYYNTLYNDPLFSKKVVSNAIYDLSKVKQKAKEDKSLIKTMGFDNLNESADASIQKPAKILIEVAEKARLMATTLWFDEYQSKDYIKAAIVATGQFTSCYNLLKHLIKLEQQGLDTEQQQLKKSLIADWVRFNLDPYYLYNELGSNTPGFVPIK